MDEKQLSPEANTDKPAELLYMQAGEAESGKTSVAVTSSVVPVLHRGLMVALSCYHPVPIMKPEPDADLDDLPALHRITEVCRFKLAEGMYSLSPQGSVQAWWKLLLTWLAVLLPTFAALYLVLLGIAYSLYPVELAALTARNIITHIGVATLVALGVGLAVSLFIVALKGFGILARNTTVSTVIAGVLLAVVLLIAVAWLMDYFSMFTWLERVKRLAGM